VLCLFLSVVLGGIGGAVLLLKKKKGDAEMPFGPFIAVAAFVCALYGNGIIMWYLKHFLLV
jgi:leader peptidase (prepilin peptidase)/N-methyltransferase